MRPWRRECQATDLETYQLNSKSGVEYPVEESVSPEDSGEVHSTGVSPIVEREKFKSYTFTCFVLDLGITDTSSRNDEYTWELDIHRVKGTDILRLLLP